MSIEFTQEELNEFRELYNMSGSHHQIDRVRSRLEMPRFVKDKGEEKCDAMFEVLKQEPDFKE